MRRFALLITLAAAFAASTHAFAAESTYPTRPIRFIVPYSPGGTSDLVGRFVGDALTARLGQQLVVDNRAGAGSVLGTQIAARSNPDGYTIIVNNIGLAVNETLRPSRGYVALKDLAPITLVGFTPSLLVVNNNSSFKTLSDWVSQAKTNPGKISFGSAGAGSSTHLSMAYLESIAGVKLLHVPYRGGGPAVRAMMGGEVQCVMVPIPTVFGHLKAGRIRALVVSTAKRSSLLPDVPTVAEAGVKGYEFSTWYGLLTPAKTPKAIIERLNRAANDALNSRELREKLQKTGLDPHPGTSEEFRKFIQSEIAKWRKVIEEAGIPKQS